MSGNATSTDQAVPRLEWLWEKRMFACYSCTNSLLAFVLDFAIEGPLASNRPCLFLRGVFFLSSQQSTYNASNYSIALTAATSSDLDFLVMQHLPTKAYQNSSDCEKRGCLLVTVVQLTPCFRRLLHLPSMGLCDRSSFGIEGPSKDL